MTFPRHLITSYLCTSVYIQERPRSVLPDPADHAILPDSHNSPPMSAPPSESKAPKKSFARQCRQCKQCRPRSTCRIHHIRKCSPATPRYWQNPLPVDQLPPAGFLLSSTLFFLFSASHRPRRSPNSLQAFNLDKALPTTAFPPFAW